MHYSCPGKAGWLEWDHVLCLAMLWDCQISTEETRNTETELGIWRDEMGLIHLSAPKVFTHGVTR